MPVTYLSVDLAFLVLEQIRLGAVEDPDSAGDQRRSVLAGIDAPAARFDADEANVLIIDESREYTYCVAAAAHTGDDHIGEPADYIEGLLAGLFAYRRLEVLDYRRIWVGAAG